MVHPGDVQSEMLDAPVPKTGRVVAAAGVALAHVFGAATDPLAIDLSDGLVAAPTSEIDWLAPL